MSQFCRKKLAVLPLLVAIFALLSLPLQAQSFFGSMVGTVADASGAAVSNAAVTITNLGTNEKHTVQTDAAGNYRFVSLLPANYSVEVEAANYKRFSRSPIAVQVGATTRIDTSLEVGSTTETVQVTTQAPLLQTESGSMSSMVEGARVQEMPLNGRNTMNLIALVPGVVPQGSSQGGTGVNQGTHTNSGGWGNYQIGGGIAGQSAMYIDGATLNVMGNGVALVPTQDAVQEFNVVMNSVTADYGRFGGGVVNMTTKSGTNKFHGSTYEFIRNKVFNANDFFSKRSGSDRPKWNVNQYGVTASGPVVKDKGFFLFTWEGMKSRLGIPSPTNVPTGDATNASSGGMQNGVFTHAISDPLGNCNISHPAGSSTWTITNLAGCGDATAKVMRKYYPVANQPSNANSNYYSAPVIADNQNQYNGRVDYNLGANQHLFGRYTYWAIDDTGLNPFNNANGFQTANGRTQNWTQQFVLGDTYTVNPTTVVDLRLSYLRQTNIDSPAKQDADESQFGANFGALSSSMQATLLPALSLYGQNGLYDFQSMFGLSASRYNNYTINASLIKMLAKHSLKFGMEARLMQNNGTGFVMAPSGWFQFNGEYTGDEFADFLMGYEHMSLLGKSKPTSAFNYYQAYYATDTWQVNRNLTVNLGLRWELPGTVAESHDSNTVLLPNAPDPITGYTGKVVLVNSALYKGRGTQNSERGLFAPRVGFAYRMGSNMAIRGGYGISFLPPDLTGVTPNNSPINSYINANGNFGAPLSPGPACGFMHPGCYRLSNPYPSGIVGPPATKAAQQTLIDGLGDGNGNVGSAVPGNPFPYTQQWNLSLSRQMKGDWMVEASYAGAKGTHLPGPPQPQNADNLNQLPSKYWGRTDLGNNTVPSDPHSMKIGQSLRPHPQYKNLADKVWNVGGTNYHALSVKSEKRFGSGGVLMLAYSWAKLIGDTDSGAGQLEVKATPATRTSGNGVVQNYDNLKEERSILSYNVSQRAVVSYILNLPFGDGQKYAHLKGAGGALVSGWAINGITTLQTGFPLALQMARGNSLTDSYGAGQLRPNYTPGATGCNNDKFTGGSSRDRINQWFNTACFTTPGDMSLGTEKRVDSRITGHGMKNFDISALKTTKIRENMNLQFRAEFYNVFNRVQFAPPVIQLGDNNFGKILAQGNQPRLIQFSARFNF